MSTLQMLDVLIGIIFIYLLLSFICSAISEMIEGFLKKRASDLRSGIRELFQSDNDELVEKFYRHPLISCLYRGKYNVNNSKNLPSYIPSKSFSLALLDIVLPASTASFPVAAEGKATDLVAASVAGTTSALTQPKALEPLREAILKWKESNAQQALLALVDAAGNDINVARYNIETWYNSSMDRVSGWYKRRVQWILLLSGFVLAIALNADTIAILKSLTNDPTLRNSLVAISQEYAKSSPNDVENNRPRDRISNNLKQLQDLRLPIGWDWKMPSKVNEGQNYISNYRLAIPTGLGWVTKIIGWLISGLAVSLGAPFWFDLLNKMMVIRSTVKPHEKSHEESSEDRQK